MKIILSVFWSFILFVLIFAPNLTVGAYQPDGLALQTSNPTSPPPASPPPPPPTFTPIPPTSTPLPPTYTPTPPLTPYTATKTVTSTKTATLTKTPTYSPTITKTPTVTPNISKTPTLSLVPSKTAKPSSTKKSGSGSGTSKTSTSAPTSPVVISGASTFMRLVVGGDSQQLTSAEQAQLVNELSQVLKNIPTNQIKIVASQGKTLIVELPSEYATMLKTLYDSKDPTLTQTLQLQTVEVFDPFAANQNLAITVVLTPGTNPLEPTKVPLTPTRTLTPTIPPRSSRTPTPTQTFTRTLAPGELPPQTMSMITFWVIFAGALIALIIGAGTFIIVRYNM